MKRWMVTMVAVAVLATVAMGQEAAAPAVTVDDLVAASEKTLKDVKSLSAELSMQQGPMTLKGTFLSMPPESLKMTLATQNEEAGKIKMRMFMHQGVMFSEMTQGTMQMVSKVNVKEVREEAEKAKLPSSFSVGADDFSSMLSSLKKQGYELKVTEVKDDVATVVADPAGKTMLGQPMQKMTLLVSTKDGLPRQVTVDNPMAGQSVMKLSDYKFNVDAKPEDFVYKAPEGVEPMDMTPMLLNMIKAEAEKAGAAPAPEAPKTPEAPVAPEAPKVEE